MSKKKSTHTDPFTELLFQNKKRLIKRWLERITATYPEDTSKFLLSKKSQFANPVGYTLSTEVEHIFGEFLKDKHGEDLTSYVDAIVRIRAVQDYTPSGAVAIFYLLKPVVREELWSQVMEQGLINDLLSFEDKVDQVSLHAFDLYMKCREKVWELKSKEAQHRTKNLLKRAGVSWEFQDEEVEELKPLKGACTPNNG